MKPTDYVIQEGTLPVQFQRAVRINDTTSQLTVEAKLNNKKGTFVINGKMDFNQVSANDELDIATIEIIADLMMEARNYCLKWLEDWKGAPRVDAQLPFPEDTEDTEE